MLEKLFKTGVWIKGLFGVTDVLMGLIVLFLGSKSLGIVQRIFTEELLEDSKDWIANHIINFAQGMSLSTTYFIAFYLIFYGGINLILVTLILKNKVKYYSWILVVLSLMIFYQVYRFFHTHSFILLFFTILNIFIAVMLYMSHRKHSRQFYK